ncbi:MAG: tetratricopeptide repeat protein [Gammaproteobacteria bacterium]
MSLFLRQNTVIFYLSCLLILTGCTTSHTQNTPVKESADTYPKSSPSPSVESQVPSQDSTPTASESAIELLEIARQQAAAGEGDKAAATLERAIQIEPDNPWLWHRLAVLRMQQKKWSQAVEMANRSIALANGNKRLIGGNWLVISLALEGAGKYESAAKAKKNSDVYLEK